MAVLRSAINLVHFSFYIQLLIATCLYLGVTGFDDQAKNLDSFKTAILFCCLSSLISNLSEVFYVEMLLEMNFTLRAKAEGVGILLKGAVIYLLIQKQYGLLAYSLGELALNCCVFTIYYLSKAMDRNPVNSQLIFNRYFKINPLAVVSAEDLKKNTGFL